MNEKPEKFELRSMNAADDRIESLRKIFPEVFKEGHINFDALQCSLGNWIDPGKERFGLNWSGKSECMKIIQQPSIGTLLPLREESVNFDTSDNIIIEGDNLEVLKLLQKSYYGKIKMIYIDPPYNTGNEFIYPDNFHEGLQDYLKYSGQINEDGLKLSTNTESDGRYHSKWLNMMYPRLFLARNLLKNDGVLFVSIDENELHYLRALLNEIFGEENYIGTICWKNVTDNNPTLINKDNEFILCFAKEIELQPKFWKSSISEAKNLLLGEYEKLKESNLSNAEIQKKIRDFIIDNEEAVGYLTRYKHVDDLGVYTGSESVHNPRPGGYDFEILHPVTKKPMRKPANGYRFPEKTFRQMEYDGLIIYGEDENRIVKIKKYLKDYEESFRSIITMDGRLGSYDLKRLFNSEKVFDNPKPVALLKQIFSFVLDKEAIVLDFFAGSGTTAQALFELNQVDNGHRQFILTQLPEKIAKSVYSNIAQLTRERVRRSSEKILEKQEKSKLMSNEITPDCGFRAYKLSSSNFKVWQSDIPNINKLGETLELFVDHVDENRNAEDILYELLLKAGYPLTAPIKKLIFTNKEVYSICEGALLICLDRSLTLEVIEAMVEHFPVMIICLDEGFKNNDQLKVNVVQTIKSHNQSNESAIVFRVV